MITNTVSLVQSYVEHERLLGKSESSIEAFSYALNRFQKQVKIDDLRDVSPKDLEKYWEATTRAVSRNAAHQFLRIVRRFFRHLVESNLLLVDPTEDLPLPRLERLKVGNVLSQEHFEQLIDACDVSEPTGIRDRAIVEFLYSTGLRRSEFRRIKVGDVDLGKAEAIVRNGKGAKDRVQPLSSAAVEWLGRYLKQIRPMFERQNPGVEEVFIGARGKALSAQIAIILVRNIGKRAGLPFHLTCHVIRRTLATDLLKSGANPAQVAAFLGHTNLKSLRRYVVIAARDVKETHEAFHPREKDEVDDE